MDGSLDRFLFVNKTAKSGSLSHSKFKEKTNIYSHVHGKYHKDKRRIKGQVCIRDAASLPIRSSASSALLCKKDSFAKLTRALPSDPGDQYRRDQETGICARNGESALCKQINGSAIDPFFCSSVTLDAKDQHLLSYPFKSFIESTFRAESLSDFAPSGNFRHRQAIIERLQRCIVDDLTMYTTLAYCASCMRWAVGEDDPERPAELYLVKGIEALRIRLKQANFADPWMVSSIYSLAVCEMWAENYDAATAHLKMVSHFLVPLGGLVNLSPYLMESILLCDKYVAIGKLEPQMLILDWEPAPLPEMTMLKVESRVPLSLRSLAQGFSGTIGDVLGEDLLLIINDIVTCIQVAEYVKTESLEHIDAQRWLFLRHQALVSRLLSLQLSSHIQACTRIALLIWLLKITAYFGAQRWSKRLLGKLKLSILRLSSSGEWVPSTLLFWMTCLGAMTAEYTDERDWFLERTLKLARSMALPLEKEPFRQLLQRYFFIKSEDGLQFFRMVRAVRELEEEKAE